MSELINVVCVLFLSGFLSNHAQEILQYEATRRTPNSIEINGCMSSSVSSSLVDGVKTKLLADLQLMVESSGVYFIQRFSNVKNSQVCLAFVYQAMTPEIARNSLTSLNLQRERTVQLETGELIPVLVAANVWQGFDEPLFGIGWNLNANDLVLWGGGLGALLVACIIGFCCLIYYYLKKERGLILKALRASKNKEGRLDQNKT